MFGGLVVNKVRNEEEKKTEHTRMYAQLCSSMSAIFTVVVVYSRTNNIIS